MLPSTLNGYPVIHSAPRDHDLLWVMCFRQDHPYHKFVVATWSPHNPTEWSWGNYAEDLIDAMRIWKSRVRP